MFTRATIVTVDRVFRLGTGSDRDREWDAVGFNEGHTALCPARYAEFRANDLGVYIPFGAKVPTTSEWAWMIGHYGVWVPAPLVVPFDPFMAAPFQRQVTDAMKRFKTPKIEPIELVPGQDVTDWLGIELPVPEKPADELSPLYDALEDPSGAWGPKGF